MTENVQPEVDILNIIVIDNDKPDSNNILSDIALSGDDAQYFTVEVFGTYGVLKTRYETSYNNIIVCTMYSVICMELYKLPIVY